MPSLTIDVAIAGVLSSIAGEAIEEVWNREIRSFQTKVISHILSMNRNPFYPQCALLAQSTGAGKSSAC